MNTDIILNKIYLSNYTTLHTELITYNSNFHFALINLNTFAFLTYIFYICKNLLHYNPINKTSISLAFVYINYTLHILLHNDISLASYEFNRHIMWLFSTPLMLQMYCDINNMTLVDIKAHYHVIPLLLYIFVYPYKRQTVYYIVLFFSWFLLSKFIQCLYAKRNRTFTNIILFIWMIFMCINIVEILQLTTIYNINLFYAFADLISKMMTTIIVSDYNERELVQINNMDLQSVQFVSYMIKNIKKYQSENAVITGQCNQFIDVTRHQLLVKIPENKTALEQELLKKILPFDFYKGYIENKQNMTDIDEEPVTNVSSKHFDMICVLFTDIVNYTELASKHNDTVIFRLLYSIYITFDQIIKKYPHLQKIETIGDAYMVVGDIFRTEHNYKTVVKEIILFALDIMKEIKTITTPDNEPLSIRIGINMGNVSVGILGDEIPRLCVVGSAVNKASRLQSTADINSIQLSRHVYEQLDEADLEAIGYDIVTKENVFLKNLGSVTTYSIYPPPPKC